MGAKHSMCNLSLTHGESLSEALVFILELLDGVLKVANEVYRLLQNC